MTDATNNDAGAAAQGGTDANDVKGGTAVTPTNDAAKAGGDAAAGDKQPSFRDNVSADWKDKYTEFKTVDDVFKGYDGLVKKLGKNPIVVPGEDATEEQKTEFKQQLFKLNGRPEKAEEYTFTVPEELGEGAVYQPLVDGLRVKAHEVGIGKDQFEALAGIYFEQQQAFMKEFAPKTDEQKMEEGMAALKEEWGAAHESNLRAALAFAKASGALGEGFEEKYGSDPVFVKAFHKLAKKYGEDSADLTGGGSKEAARTAAELRSQLGELQKKPEYYNMMSPSYEHIRQEAARISAQIVEAEGRAKK